MKFRTCAVVLALVLIAAPVLAQQSVVAKYRSLYPTPMSADQLLALERAVAAEVHGGLLKKPDGSNCGGYSCDIICFSDAQLFDILGDAEGAGAPQWSQTSNPRGYHCELVEPAPSPPASLPPPPPPSDLEARIAALEQRIAALEAKGTAAVFITPPTPTPTPANDLAADVKRIRTLLELVAKRFGLQ